jgi:hypothetical protein
MYLREIGWGVWSGFTLLWIELVARSGKCGYEPPGSGTEDLVT